MAASSSETSLNFYTRLHGETQNTAFSILAALRTWNLTKVYFTATDYNKSRIHCVRVSVCLCMYACACIHTCLRVCMYAYTVIITLQFFYFKHFLRITPTVLKNSRLRKLKETKRWLVLDSNKILRLDVMYKKAQCVAKTASFLLCVPSRRLNGRTTERTPRHVVPIQAEVCFAAALCEKLSVQKKTKHVDTLRQFTKVTAE
jgi:hypothetical protein